MIGDDEDFQRLIDEDVIDIPSEVEVVSDEETLPAVPSTPAEDIEADYQTARTNLKTLHAKGIKSLDGIIELAKTTDHPRAYEVVGQLIKAMADVNQQAMDLHKDMAAIKKKDPTGGPSHVVNALFVGSTHALQRMLKGQTLDELTPEDDA